MKRRLPEIGDVISLPTWHHEWYEVTRLGKGEILVEGEGSLWVAHEGTEVEYPRDNDWIFRAYSICGICDDSVEEVDYLCNQCRTNLERRDNESSASSCD